MEKSQAGDLAACAQAMYVQCRDGRQPGTASGVEEGCEMKGLGGTTEI